MDLSRNNGDVGISYLVNDDKLNLKSLVKKNVIIIGERHGNTSDEKLLLDLIKVVKPNYVLCEALGDYKLLSKDIKLEHMEREVTSHYYHGFTKHWIELSLKAPDTPFIGIEYTAWDDKVKHNDLSYKESFKIRETHFLKMIKKYAKVGRVIAVVGDTHMRSIETKALGPISPLYQTFINDKDAAVIRSQKGEIE